MKDSEISETADLDAALAARAMSRREKLWKAAQGGSFRWTDVVASVIGAALALTGMYGTLVLGDVAGSFQVAFGTGLLCFSMLRRQQIQIDALREIVRTHERQNN